LVVPRSIPTVFGMPQYLEQLLRRQCRHRPAPDL